MTLKNLIDILKVGYSLRGSGIYKLNNEIDKISSKSDLEKENIVTILNRYSRNVKD